MSGPSSAKQLAGTYWRPLERLDSLYKERREGETGPLVRRRQSYGDLQDYVSGTWGEGSEALHS